MNSDRSGQASALMVFTPIVPGREDSLLSYLTKLGTEGAPSPLDRVPGTHFARWAVVDKFAVGRKQHSRDDLALSYLVFTSNFDGPADAYIDRLWDGLGPTVDHVWGCCVGCPSPATGPTLRDYLLHNRIKTGLFFSAYPHATVADVRRSLRVRDRMIEFALGAQQMMPVTLQDAFLEAFGRDTHDS